MGKNLKQRWIWTTCALLGLWCLGGCGSRPAQESSLSQEQTGQSKPKVRIELHFDSNRYDLERDEGRGGHTLARHVARTDEQLRERLEQERNISAASTWTDRETAESVVAEALAAEHNRVESWTRRGYPRANLALHYDTARVIGRSLRRGETQSANCTRAVIVLRADGDQNYYVLTAYPEASE